MENRSGIDKRESLIDATWGMVPEGDKAAMLIRNEQPQRLVGAALVGGKYWLTEDSFGRWDS